ncbi:CD59 glycoprotein-like [Boleophthalmus pectinirostris]|uniref:CD59 glycoprotein-like n=1 Tax=Boleophthalmus pectinirostris TaxID=150288 RepID=UPI00242E905B|nr:CD59 glycoprotein-like [Boleophthalmus pectinirostris]
MFVKAFLLLVGLSTAYSLKCYYCFGCDKCNNIMDCGSDPSFDRCYSGVSQGVSQKACIRKSDCVSNAEVHISCCEGDLCNGSASSGPAVVLLLLSSSIFTLFL